MPPLAHATLALAAGLLLVFRFPGTGPVLLIAAALITVVALGVRSATRDAIHSLRLTKALERHSASWPRTAVALLAFVLAGNILGQLALHSSTADCRTRLPDGAHVEVRGLLEALPTDGRATFRLREVRVGDQAVACRGAVRARLPRPPRSTPPAAPEGEQPGPEGRQAGSASEQAGPEGEQAGTESEQTGPEGEQAGPEGAAELRAGESLVAWGRWWVSPARGPWPQRPAWRGTLALDSLLHSAPERRPGTNALLVARADAQDRLRTLFPERSALAEALLLAQRDGIDPAVRERFVRSGLTHLLAISGLHVGLIAGGLLLLGRLCRLPARAAMVTAGLVTAAYVVFLGAPHAAARAALQLLLLLAARLAQRPSNPFGLLAAAALPLLVLDPFAILDAGFQLSFAGTAGILALRRRFLSAFPGDRLGRHVSDALATSLAATLATAPIVALHFGRIAPIGILAGLPALPVVALTVPALAITLAASSVSWPAAHFLAGAADALLATLDTTARIAASLPAGHVYVPRDALFAWTAAAVIAALAVARLAALRPRIRRVAAAGIAIAFVVAWPVGAARIGTGELEIHAIDVGQGDAFALRSPGGRWLLVDTGPVSDTFDAGRARVVPFLLRRGVRRLDAVILTHPHADHIGGLGAVWDAFRVSAVFDPGVAAASSLYISLLRDAADRGKLWFAARAGREIRFDGVTIEFLYPEDGMLDVGDDANELSVVFRLTYGDFAALFTGDAYDSVEELLVAAHGEGLRSDLLKVGHHGSATSTSEALLEATTPSTALLSMGRRNIYGHPAPIVLERLDARGVQVWRTDEHGNIGVIVDPDGRVQVRAERTP